VRANPKGYEIGIARAIRLTDAGRAHPMFAGKADGFATIAIHRDEVVRLPAAARLLAGNDVSAVQAVEIEDGGRSFWGVQYHPEFTLGTIAGLVDKLKRRLVKDGFARREEELADLATDWRALDADPARRDLAWKYGIGSDVLDPRQRRAELSAWLDHKVVPRATARAAAAG
jgi:GMP synthase (glutamine-hydrolysing)